MVVISCPIRNTILCHLKGGIGHLSLDVASQLHEITTLNLIPRMCFPRYQNQDVCCKETLTKCGAGAGKGHHSHGSPGLCSGTCRRIVFVRTFTSYLAILLEEVCVCNRGEYHQPCRTFHQVGLRRGLHSPPLTTQRAKKGGSGAESPSFR